MEFDKETQTRILRIAADRQEGKSFEELDARIAHVMDMHPEFEDIWKQGEMAAFPQEINGKIVSPFVHTVLHVTIDKQLEGGDPDFVSETYSRLIKQGIYEHDGLHAIMGVYSELYFTAIRQGKQFDSLDYESQLSHLSFKKSGE
jgi:hypothetical protein